MPPYKTLGALPTSLGLLKLKSNIACTKPILCQLVPIIIELTPCPSSDLIP